MAVTISSINVRGLNEKVKRKNIFHFLSQHENDIICLQETHQNSENIKKWTREWGGKSVWNPGSQGRSAGVAILFKKHLNIKIVNTKSDADGRILRVTLESESLKFQILTIYGPNPENEEASENFFKSIQLENPIIQDENHKAILIGNQCRL